jgi:glycerate kinase
VAGGEGEEKKDVEKEGGAGGRGGMEVGIVWTVVQRLVIGMAIVKDFRL